MKKDNKSSVVTLILLLVLLAVGLFWFKPNLEAQSVSKNAWQMKEEEKKVLEASLKSLQEAQANLAGSSEITRQTVLDAIPEKLEQDKLIHQINKIVRENDINLSSIGFSIPLNSSEAVKKATVNLSMTGGEDDLLRLLKGLENNPRKLVTKSVTVQFGQTQGISRVNFNISLETYFQAGI